MLRDPLQKRLQERERENPSPTSKAAKPRLRDGIGFLVRYFSRVAEQIPQKSSIYGSLDDQCRDYKKAVEFEGHEGQGQYWLDEAFDEARSGEPWIDIATCVDIARNETGFAGSISPELMQKLRTLYSEGMRTMGPVNALSWVDYAFKEARSGELWSDITISLDIARAYAREARIPLDVDMERLITTYKEGIQVHGPKKASYWIKVAGVEAARRKPRSQIKLTLSIARDYAREAGMKI